MRKFPTILTAFALIVWPEPAALAGEKQPPEQNPAVQQEAVAKDARQLSKDVGEAIEKSNTFYCANLYPEAIAILKNAQAQFELNPYEAATIHQMLGSALYETDDYDGAILAFETAISSGGLLPKEASNLRVHIAQLLIVNGKPAPGAQMLEDWVENGGTHKPKHIEYLWQAWSQAEQYDRALPWAEKWFENADPIERKHYDLLYFIYRELEMQDECAKLITRMHARWPNDEHISNIDYVLNGKKRKLWCWLETYCK